MDDEFNDYLSKYNEEMDDKNMNPNADRSFLDNKERPTDLMIVNLFITPDDILHGVDLEDYDIKKLGNPDKIKTIEGTEWILSKLVWYKEEGRVITFDIVKLSTDLFDIGGNALIIPTLDIPHKEVKKIGYHARLEKAVEEEDYSEASRLRDWLKDFKELSSTIFPLMQKAINGGKFGTYNSLMKQLNDHTDKL